MDTYLLAKLILIGLVILIAVVCILLAIQDSTNQQSSNAIIRYTQNGNTGNDSSKGNKYSRYNGKQQTFRFRLLERITTMLPHTFPSKYVSNYEVRKYYHAGYGTFCYSYCVYSISSDKWISLFSCAKLKDMLAYARKYNYPIHISDIRAIDLSSIQQKG